MTPNEHLKMLKERVREFAADQPVGGDSPASVAAARRELDTARPKRRGRRSTLWHRSRVRPGDVNGKG